MGILAFFQIKKYYLDYSYEECFIVLLLRILVLPHQSIIDRVGRKLGESFQPKCGYRHFN